MGLLSGRQNNRDAVVTNTKPAPSHPYETRSRGLFGRFGNKNPGAGTGFATAIDPGSTTLNTNIVNDEVHNTGAGVFGRRLGRGSFGRKNNVATNGAMRTDAIGTNVVNEDANPRSTQYNTTHASTAPSTALSFTNKY